MPLDQPKPEDPVPDRIAAGLARLHGVIIALSGALSVAEVANIIMTQGVDALGADAGLVALLNDSVSELQLIDSRGYDPSILQVLESIPLSQPSVLTEAVRTKTPLWLSSIAQQLQEHPTLLVLPLSAGFQARAALPLKVDTELIGVLQLNFLHERPFDAAERTVLEALAAAGAQALDRARVYDQQQRSLRRLKTLRTIDQSVLTGQPSEAIVGRALEDLYYMVPYQVGFVAVTLADSNQPHIVASRDWNMLSLNTSSEPLIEPVHVAHMFDKPLLHYIPDLNRLSETTPQTDYLLDHHVRCLLTMPLYADGLRIGQIDLFSSQPGAFSEEAQHIVSEIGNQIAVVLRQEFLSKERERAEERFRLVVEASPNGLIMADTKGLIVLINPEIERMFGYTRDELIGQPVDMLVPSRFRQHHAAYRTQFAARPEVRSMNGRGDLYGLRKDGSEFPVEIGLNPIYTSTGLHILSAIVDITERKRAEQAIKENEQKLGALFELLPVGVSILNDERKVVYTNLALEHILELPIGLVLEGAYQQRTYIRPDGSPMQQEDFASSQALRTQQAVYDVETGIVKEDGEITWVSVNAAPVDFPDWRAVIVTADITERKRGEEALRQSEERFATAFKSSPAAMLISRQSDGVFLDVNASYEQLLGYRHDELVGQTSMTSHIYTSPTQRNDLVRLLQERGSLRDEELTLRAKSGELLTVLGALEAITINGEACFIGSMVDITKRKQAEHALRQSEERFSKAFNAGQIAMVISTVAEGRIVDANPSFLHLFGREPSEVIGHTSTLLDMWLDPKDRDRAIAILRQHGNIRDLEVSIRAAQGAIRNVILSADFLMIGAEQCILTTLYDVTERKQAEEEIKRSNERLRLLAHASQVFAEAGIDTNTLASKVARQMVDVLGDFCIMRFLADDQQSLSAVALAHYDESDTEAITYIRNMVANAPLRVDEPSIDQRVFTTGEALLVPVIDFTKLRARIKPEYREGIERFQPHSMILVPLKVQNQAIGLLGLYRSRPKWQAFTEDDLRLAQDLADRAALAISNAQLFRQVEAELSERLQAEQALRQSEERFRNYFELGLVGMALASTEQYFLDVNDQLCTMLGYERSELLHTKWANITHPDDVATDIDMFKQVMAGQIEGFSRDKRYIHKNGQIVDAIVSVRALRRADGSVDYLLVLMQDITERKRAEAALYDREEYLRVLTETMPAVPWSATPAGQIDYFTQRWLDLTGMTQEQAFGEGWQNIVHPDDLPAMATAWQHSLATGEPYDTVHRIHTADGTYRWQRSRALPQQDHDGRIIRWHGITDDIEELRAAEDRVRESEARFRQLSERLPQLVWTCDPHGLCDYLGPQWVAYTGIPEAEQLGFQWINQLHPDDRQPTTREWQDAVEKDNNFHVEFRIRRHDGVYRWFDTRAVPLKDAAGQTVKWFGTNTDIEENKRNQLMLQRYTDQLQRLSHQLVEVQEVERRSIAHELHDQVGQALTGLKLLFDSTATLSSPQLPEQLGEARRAINELLERVRTLSLDLRPSMLDDLGLLPALKWLIERYTAQTSVQVLWWHQNIDRRFSSIIETSVYRTVQEALTNVARHAKTDRVEVRLMADDEQFLIQIDDEGQGFNLEAALQSRQSVGLIGMRERIELLSGSFLIESAPGQGTHLNVGIPFNPLHGEQYGESD